MEAKKQNARFALNLLHGLSPVIPFQSQMEPQTGSMKLASRPKATIQSTKRIKSAGQWKNELMNGKRKMMA